MAKLSPNFRIPDYLFDKYREQGAVNIITNIKSYPNAESGTTEYAIVVNVTYADGSESEDEPCPRPCPDVDDDGDGKGG